MSFIDTLLSSDLYKKMLEQLPEEERPAAIEELREELQPLESLMAIAPGSIDVVKMMLSSQQPKQIVKPAEARRNPRRF
jgi:predicted O-methyltransferase YrrM